MKIVKFENGNYGVRKGFLFGFGYEYLALNNDNSGNFDYWWSGKPIYVERYCQGTLEQVNKALDLRKRYLEKSFDAGKPV